MPITRTAQPIPVSVPGLQVATLATSTATPIGISRDGRSIFGSASSGQVASSNTLYESTNDGSSWSTVFAFPSTERVQGIRETDDGEVLVITQANAGTPGYLYKSTGWSTSHTSATWTKVLTSIGGYFRAYWSGGHTWSFGDDTIAPGTSKIGIVSEYGIQTSSSGDQTTTARRVYLTQDYGATWTQALDLYTRYGSGTTTNMHVHFVAYDPYWNRLWALIGDNYAAEGYGNYPILYSDDLGATWTAVPATAPWYNASQGFFQATSMAILPDSIILGIDVVLGAVRFPRKGYRRLGAPDLGPSLATHTGNLLIATGVHQNRRQPGAPVLLGFNAQATTVLPAIYASLDSGQTLARLWADPANPGAGNQILGVYGPTASGKIVAVYQAGSTYNLLVGEIIDPGPNHKVGAATVSGDGSTTAFSFAHGLGVVPTRYLAWNEKPAGSYTVTADATNVTVTFSAAPSNGAIIPFQWRAAS